MKRVITSFIMILFIFGIAEGVTKTGIKPEELNKTITEDISQKFPDYKIYEAFKVNNNGRISYEVHLQHLKKELILYYDEKGSFLRKEVPSPIKTNLKGKNKTFIMIRLSIKLFGLYSPVLNGFLNLKMK